MASYISNIVTFWSKLLKARQLKCKSFVAVKDAVEDELTTVKLSFFSYFASLLLKYQTKESMIPYMYADIVNLVRSVLQIVVKQDIIDGYASGQDLRTIDLDKEEVFKKKKHFHLGFAAEDKLKKLEDLVKISDVSNFRNTKKDIREEPCSDSKCCCFNPKSIFATKEDILKKFKPLLQHFVSLKLQNPSHADKVFNQYKEFLKNDMKMVNKDDDIGQLDYFFFKKLKVSKYPGFL